MDPLLLTLFSIPVSLFLASAWLSLVRIDENNDVHEEFQDKCCLTFFFGSVFLTALQTTLYPLLDLSVTGESLLKPIVIVSLLVGIFLSLFWGILYYRSQRQTAQIVVVFLMFLLLGPLMAYGYICFFNGLLDTSKPQRYKAYLIRKEARRSKSGRKYQFYVADWQHPSHEIDFRVDSRIYSRARERTHIDVLTRNGAFGMPWLQNVEVPKAPQTPP